MSFPQNLKRKIFLSRSFVVVSKVVVLAWYDFPPLYQVFLMATTTTFSCSKEKKHILDSDRLNVSLGEERKRQRSRPTTMDPLDYQCFNPMRKRDFMQIVGA